MAAKTKQTARGRKLRVRMLGLISEAKGILWPIADVMAAGSDVRFQG